MRNLTLREFYGDTLLKSIFSKETTDEPRKGFRHKLLANDVVQGSMYYRNCNQFIVCYQDWTVLAPFHLSIDHPENMIKFQFEIEGSSIFTATNGRQISLSAGQQQFIYLPPTAGTLHYACSRKVLDVHIEEDFLCTLLSAQGFAHSSFREHFSHEVWTFFREAASITLEQEALIHQLIAHSYHGEFAGDYIRCKTIEIILSVFSAGVEPVEQHCWKKEDLRILSDIKTYLDSHFSENLSLKKISRTFGINEFKLKKAFKERYGETVFGYIRKNKLKHGLHLLLHTDTDIKEIAYSCGFKYAHHFSQLFLQHYNYRPSEVRSKSTGVLLSK
ncbi:helix-turn-helix transcriptional regulator [Sphingobacterium tabacisoli]|uniref:Helix-turn-helix domain-containing protein n=1 Tax=Sphingobacterium tabacisoli TaxID=2044855 RepID=A0ABW5L1V8_9SPHI|nr:AraC family transcriptional regulator [Sphingobacterium tabacisoli]